jgi:hypothetical protein
MNPDLPNQASRDLGLSDLGLLCLIMIAKVPGAPLDYCSSLILVIQDQRVNVTLQRPLIRAGASLESTRQMMRPGAKAASGKLPLWPGGDQGD